MQRKKGFTLIEILVVCAIIAILAGAVVAATGPSRAKARDSRRLSDMTQIRTVLESYFAEQPRTNASYPAQTTLEAFNSSVVDALTPEHIAAMPADPNSVTPYLYKTVDNGKGYCLAAQLEVTNSVSIPHDTTCGAPTDYNYVFRR